MKRNLLRSGLALLALLALAWGVERYSDANRHQLFGEIVAKVDTREKVIALAFDDGPTAAATQDVLKILSNRNVVATFFVNGIAVEKHPDAMRAIIAAGHEVGNHGSSHRRLMLVSPATVREELQSTDEILRTAGYEGVLHFRPPYGRKLFSLPWVLSQQERLTVMWSVAAETFQPDQTAEDIAQRVLAQAGPGDIVMLHLMHRGNANSRTALPVILDDLAARGYRFVTVSELLKLR